ncbi:MAG: LacI family repressor for deo operon, udp, cdd, tsx, nupC, and nupG [Paracoccaceae bacterium]|jgi:LacI family repressor for deo operon, udp, cdd, tsx, nupC, and nupG
MTRKTATIQDVARIAGVSTATVSRALSTPDVVAQSTRDAVARAVEDTGYRVNRTARNLRRQRTGNVIALAPNLANPFFSQILSGMASALTAASYDLLIVDTQTGPDPDARLIHCLRSGMADGLVLLDGALSPAILAGVGRPPVITACEWLDAPLPSVRVDNAAGAAMAVAHLVDMGHRRIGHITGPAGNVLTDTRRNGFDRAMQDAGLPLRPNWIFGGDFSMDSGAFAAARWMVLPDRPTAVFCASDEMAVGFMGALQHAGVGVPEQVSVIGFDNIEVAAHLTPALTTIRQPRSLIGMRAAELLIQMIDGNLLTGPTEIIPVELIRRNSVAAI